MVCDAGGHRRRALLPSAPSCRTPHAQRLMRRAEIVKRPDQPHPLLDSRCASGQRAGAPHQGGQPPTERRVEPFYEGCVAYARVVRFVPQVLDLLRVTVLHSPLDRDHAPLLIAFDDLRVAQPGPSL